MSPIKAYPIDIFDLDYGCNIVSFSLEDLGLSNLGKHLLMVKDCLQDLLIYFILLDLSNLLCI
jgi:hypothetical protein